MFYFCRLTNKINNNFSLSASLQLLDECYFRDVEKIKTIGSSYMAASGLSPDRQVSHDVWHHHQKSSDKRQYFFPWSVLSSFLVFRSVRTAGITSVSWSCSRWPCRKHSNTSTHTQETASSSESVRTSMLLHDIHDSLIQAAGRRKIIFKNYWFKKKKKKVSCCSGEGPVDQIQ